MLSSGWIVGWTSVRIARSIPQRLCKRTRPLLFVHTRLFTMSHNYASQTGHHMATSPTGDRAGDVALPKKLIVCCDGTWMDSDNSYTKPTRGHPGKMQNPTNVTRISRAIAPEDDARHPQIVYYQAGVGTGLGLTNELLGGGTGLGLSEHIREAYAFLVDNFRGDEPTSVGTLPDSIFITGFSRGAFTARSISGLIGAVGLLRKRAMAHFYEIFLDWENAGNHDYTPQFWSGYYQLHPELPKDHPDLSLARDRTRIDEYMDQYRKRLVALGLSQVVRINAVGVWDTVGALGIPVNPFLQKLFPFLPSAVKEYSWFNTSVGNHVSHAFHALALDEHRYPFSPTLWEKRPGSTASLKQCWFPGAHSNIGGSYDDAGMSNITLAWMMDQLSGSTTEHPPSHPFEPREWIKFHEDYDKDWEHMVKTAKEKQEGAPYKGWGMGYLYESMYFPQSLLGKRIRTPGCYHRTDPVTGKPSAQLLENTNEYIHSCVRARVDMGGRGVEQDWSQLWPHSYLFWPNLRHWFHHLLGRKPLDYLPMKEREPLDGWKLRDGHKSHYPPNMDIDTSAGNDITWEYRGHQQCSIPVMREDKMGPFGQRLLARDPQLSGQIELTNDSWHWQAKGSPRLAHTF